MSVEDEMPEDTKRRLFGKPMTTWTIIITVGPAVEDGGFVDYLLGEIDHAIESTDVEDLPVTATVVVT